LDVPVKALDLPARLVTPTHVPQRGKPDRSVANKGALYFHFPTKEDLAAGIFAEHLAIALRPGQHTAGTRRLRPGPGPPAPTGHDRASAFGLWIDHITQLLKGQSAGVNC
jgi:hypothetical protein